MTSWTQVNAINIKIVVSDDFVNAPEKKKNKQKTENQCLIATHFTGGRHHQISPSFFSQSCYDVP